MSLGAKGFFLILLSPVFSTFALQVDKDTPVNLALKRTTDGPLHSSTNFQMGPDGLDYMAAVPQGEGPFPVVILLHELIQPDRNLVETVQGFLYLFDTMIKHISANHILVAPVGRGGTWNIKNELSKRDDVNLIGKQLPEFLASFSNVQPTFKFVGFSNGAGLLNRILIENDDPQIVAAVTCGSQLNVFQCHDGLLYVGGADNTYTNPKPALRPRRVLQITGGNDKIVKADGSQGLANEVFLEWSDSIYHYARAYGFTGLPLSPQAFDGYVGTNYLEGMVQAYNFQNMTHDPRYMWSAVGVLEGFLLD